MKKIAIDEVDHPPTNSPAAVVRPISRRLETTAVEANYFELAPSDTFGFDYHRHHDQEEVFVILESTATFRTEAGDVAVSEGEVVRFAPGEFQLGRNEETDRVRALAIGAPSDSTEIEYRRPCPDCDGDTIQTLNVDRDTDLIEVRCEACGTVVEAIELV